MCTIFIFAAFVACASAFEIVNYTISDTGCNCGYKFYENDTNKYIQPRQKDRAARHLAAERKNCPRLRRWTGDGTRKYNAQPLHKDEKNSGQNVKDIDDSKDARCWANKAPTRRIGLNADETGVNEFPMMAGLAFYDPVHRLTGDLYTGGTIISKRYVLTAAHVLTSMQLPKTMVILGEHHRSILDLSPHRQEILPRRFIIHERYENRVQYDSLDYDIGIIELDKTITFTKRIGPACLPFKFRDTELAGSYGTYLGWGQIFNSGPLSDVLRKINVKIISQEACRDKVVTQLSDRMLCAHSLDADACGNDSGGPLLYMDSATEKLFIVGIISHGKGCVSSYAGVNTRVTKFLDWIALVAPDNYCGQPPPVVATRHHIDNRTVTDALTEPGTYPAMAAIFYALWNFNIFAMGTILSANTIIVKASAIKFIVDKELNVQGNNKYDIGLIQFKENIKECLKPNETPPPPTTTPNSLSLPEPIKDWGTPFIEHEEQNFWHPPKDQCFNVSTLSDTQHCDFKRGKSNCDYDRNGHIVYKSEKGTWDMGLLAYGRCGFCVNEKEGGDDRVWELTDWASQSKPPVY